ncbi:MAG: DnaK suppressor protein [Kiritimatiellia bacterium]|jgi:DnaK suppressor protein
MDGPCAHRSKRHSIRVRSCACGSRLAVMFKCRDYTRAMNELTDVQIKELSTDLHDAAEELLGVLSKSKDREQTVELSSSQGRLSRMDAMQQQQMALAERRRHEVRRGTIAQALLRLDSEDYGWCTRCGEPIGYRRLKVRPEGPLCMKCLQKLGG